MAVDSLATTTIDDAEGAAEGWLGDEEATRKEATLRAMHKAASTKCSRPLPSSKEQKDYSPSSRNCPFWIRREMR